MEKKIQNKIIDYINIDHHSNKDVENVLNNLGVMGFELIEVIDMGENNTNKEGRSSRFRYIFKKNE